jgi:hypothetical protein
VSTGDDKKFLVHRWSAFLPYVSVHQITSSLWEVYFRVARHTGKCTSGIGKRLNVTESSMHMTMGRVWLLFGILCFRVALPHADGMDWLKYGTSIIYIYSRWLLIVHCVHKHISLTLTFLVIILTSSRW